MYRLQQAMSIWLAEKFVVNMKGLVGALEQLKVLQLKAQQVSSSF